MEIVNNTPTLFSALSEWNRTKDLFKTSFGEDALDDRDFGKFQLREFDRMWYAFNGGATTKDERALLKMLRFRRRKLRRSLYPALIPRMWNRMMGYLDALVSVEKQPGARKADDTYRYADYSLDVADWKKKPDAPGQSQGERYMPKHPNGVDLGGRKRTEENRQGQSL